MTREEAIEFISNKKVYVKDKSEEIQKKVFELGWTWGSGKEKTLYTDAPFLYFYSKHGQYITHGCDVNSFYNHWFNEISVEEILNITIDKPTYNQFKNIDKLWHDTSEEPKEGTNIITIIKNGRWWDVQPYNNNICDWNGWVSLLEITRWAYISDLLPREGEK